MRAALVGINLLVFWKVCIVKTMVFPVVIYDWESWTIRKAECQSIDAFKLWCWRRLLWVPWTAMRSNQSILKEINPEYSLEELILKLKLQYFGHLVQRISSLKKTLMLGKTEGRKRWLTASSTQRTWPWANSGRWWGTGKPGVLQSMWSQRIGHNLVTGQHQQQLFLSFVLEVYLIDRKIV